MVRWRLRQKETCTLWVRSPARFMKMHHKKFFKEISFNCFHTAVIMKGTIFWTVTIPTLVEVHWSFGGTYQLHLQDQSKPRKKQSRRWLQNENLFLQPPCLAYPFTLKMKAMCWMNECIRGGP
jgi:hypothetical protein